MYRGHRGRFRSLSPRRSWGRATGRPRLPPALPAPLPPPRLRQHPPPPPLLPGSPGRGTGGGRWERSAAGRGGWDREERSGVGGGRHGRRRVPQDRGRGGSRGHRGTAGPGGNGAAAGAGGGESVFVPPGRGKGKRGSPGGGWWCSVGKLGRAVPFRPPHPPRRFRSAVTSRYFHGNRLGHHRGEF